MPVFAIDRRIRLPLVCVAALIAGCSGGEARKAKHIEKGQAFLVAGNLDKARIEFRNALQIAPNDSEVRFENGVVDEKLGNRREAGQFYEGAIDADKDNVRARAALGRLYVLANAPEKALETIQPSLESHPDDPGLLTVRAAARNLLKDLAEALPDAERAVQLAPENEDSLGVLASIYQAAGQSDNAVALLEGAAKRLPQSVDLHLALAQLYVDHHQEPQAEALLLELLKLKPEQKSHRLRLAQFYARLDRIDDAERVLREAIRVLPEERDLKISLVDVLAARRGGDAAEEQLQSFITQAPKDYPLRFILARLYEENKDDAKAEAVYSDVIAAAGMDGPGLVARDHLAELHSRQNDLNGAQKLLAEVLAKAPRDDNALVLHADLALRQHDPKTAITDLRSVLRNQPNSANVMRVLARAHLANDEPALAEETLRRAVDANPTDAAARMDLARLLIDFGKPAQATPIVAELVNQQPKSIEARAAQFQIAAAAKDWPGAKAAADAIVAANPQLGIGYYYQGTVAEVQLRLNDAVRLYSASLQQTPAATESLQALTRVLVAQKRVPEALKRLDGMATQYPESATPLNIRGEVLMSQKRDAEGIAAFRSAIAREPKSWAGYRNLAFAQISDHDNGQGIATLQNAIGKVTHPEQLETALGVMFEQSGEPDQAIQIYDTALRQDPLSDLIANNLAMLLVETKQDSASLERAKQLTARFSTSDNPQLLDTFGWVLYKHGEANSAVTALQTASSKAPNLPILWYHLGMAQMLSGQTEAARASLARSLQSGQNFPGIEEAKATLSKLAARSNG